jgi:hypothetical protein
MVSAMLKRAYIHIGLEKTGTSSLQLFLRFNEAVLRSNGFSYLCGNDKAYFDGNAHFPVAACHFPLCPDFISPAKFRPAKDVLGSLRHDVQTSEFNIIISCEHFSSRLFDRNALVAIREAMPERHIRIICYLRRQDEMALAAYSTAVRSGYREPFRLEGVEHTNPYFNYRAILELWGSVFGFRNIIVREFDRDKLVGRDIREDFLDLIGLPNRQFQLTEDLNESLDSRQVEMLRQINRYLTSFDCEEDRRAYDDAQLVRNFLEKMLPASDALGVMLSNSERETVMHRFEDTNRWVAETFANADFVLGWQEPRLHMTDRSRPSVVGTEDFARVVAACGLRILELQRTINAPVHSGARRATKIALLIFRRTVSWLSRVAGNGI